MLGAALPDEASPKAVDILRRVARETAVAPIVWPLEVANGLLQAQRRGRIPEAFRIRRLAQIAGLPVAVDTEAAILAWSEVSRLASQHGLTVYDAAYLELALRKGLPLATLDAALAAAAQRASIELL